MGVFGVGLAASAAWAMSRKRLAARWALGGGLLGSALGMGLFALARAPLPMGGAALWTGLCVGPLLAASETEMQEAAGERRRPAGSYAPPGRRRRSWSARRCWR
jgi:hypothetical protein